VAAGAIAEAQVCRHERQKDGNYLYGAFGRDFTTRDGRRIMAVALTLRRWQGLVEATELHEAFATLERMMGVDLTKEGDRFEAREVIGALLKPWTGARTMAEIGEIFEPNDVCWGPYQTFIELVDSDPRCSTANPIFEQVEQPGIGAYLMPGSPLHFGVLERVPVSRAPLLGEHTDEILADLLGLSEGEIGRLHDGGGVAGPIAEPAYRRSFGGSRRGLY